MTDTGLYRLEKKDIKTVSVFLTECFYKDPLYLELVPDEKIRKQILPVFFECYLDMAFDYCEIYADSPNMDGIITIFDTSSQSGHFSYLMKVVLASMKFAKQAISIDSSMKTLYHFVKNIQFLTSDWEDDIKDKEKVHIDFFAVKPESQGKGIGKAMMNEVLAYSDKKKCLTTLETHNRKNVFMYEHYGFQMFRTFAANRNNLKEYCMVR